MSNPEKEVIETLVVGGGPAGLTAAIYLGRFRRRTLVVDDNKSRAAWIPLSRNCPGYPDGVSGQHLLERLRIQAAQFGAQFLAGTVTALGMQPDGCFWAVVNGEEIIARTVLLASGIVDRKPDMQKLREAVQLGVIRFCPICDAAETTDKKVAILASGEERVGHARFLRTYTRDVTLLSLGAPVAESERERLKGADIQLIEHVSAELVLVEGKIITKSRDKEERSFDVVYPMLGCVAETKMLAFEVEKNSIGELKVNRFQQSSVPGLYAAGDISEGLNQISVSFSQGAVAACHIHESLSSNFC